MTIVEKYGWSFVERLVAQEPKYVRSHVLKPLSSYNVAADFIEFISDEKRVNELRGRFEKIIGPVAGDYISTSPGAR